MIWALRKLLGERRGATAVEYGLILSLVVLTIMGALHAMAGQTTAMWTNTSDKVQAAR
jgi:pilus assembly protein Flp/PilA